MADVKNQLSRVSLLRPKDTEDFLCGVFDIVESDVFIPSVIIKSFAGVGLWPWNPELIRKLCQIHCPPPSELNATPVLAELESIMSKMSAEQEAKRDEIIAYGKRMREVPSTIEGISQLRPRKRTGSQDPEA